ncbi:hypothetical protein [Streptomyces kronopolitis]|uniref:hypothetical protein n=1 Tax=Streptomyces kronopolitis TaxID=1612435 RepID=UPI0020BEC9B5|nr:hypothetical protein [Streptomyces kronopolitis]MCL6299530.1 hypothetical protein [Streptomyces kronopolitis]
MPTTDHWTRVVVDGATERPDADLLRRLAHSETAVVVPRNLLPAEAFVGAWTWPGAAPPADRRTRASDSRLERKGRR